MLAFGSQYIEILIDARKRFRSLKIVSDILIVVRIFHLFKDFCFSFFICEDLSLQSQSHDTADHENDYRVSTVVYADCHSSFCGMFAGLLVLTLTFVCIILMFVGVQDK